MPTSTKSSSPVASLKSAPKKARTAGTAQAVKTKQPVKKSAAKTPLTPTQRPPRKRSPKLDTTLRSDVAEAMREDDAVLTGEQMRELVRWEAAVLGLTYDAAVAAAVKGKLPTERATKDLREHLALLGVTS